MLQRRGGDSLDKLQSSAIVLCAGEHRDALPARRLDSSVHVGILHVPYSSGLRRRSSAPPTTHSASGRALHPHARTVSDSTGSMGRRLRRCVIASCAIAGCDADHNFVLDESIRSGGTHIGTDDAFCRPITLHLPLLLASLAGVCCTKCWMPDAVWKALHELQRHRKALHWCMANQDRAHSKAFWSGGLSGSMPRRPHADHQIVNNGRDAQPIWTLLPASTPTCRRR